MDTNAKAAPQGVRAGTSRFLADYQSSTVYRVWVKVKGSWEPCSWLPAFATMTEATFAAIKIAMPTDVRAEAVKPAPTPAFCQCGHPEDEHYLGSVCQKIEGMHVCGCDTFVQEAA